MKKSVSICVTFHSLYKYITYVIEHSYISTFCIIKEVKKDVNEFISGVNKCKWV